MNLHKYLELVTLVFTLVSDLSIREKFECAGKVSQPLSLLCKILAYSVFADASVLNYLVHFFHMSPVKIFTLRISCIKYLFDVRFLKKIHHRFMYIQYVLTYIS